MEYKYKDLVSEIEKRTEKTVLEIQNNNGKERLDFLKYFFDNYHFDEVTSLTNIFPSELLTIYLMEENRDIEFDDIFNEIQETNEMIDSLGSKFLEVLVDNISEFDMDEIQELIKKEGKLNYIQQQKFSKKINNLFSKIGICEIGTNSIDNIFKILKITRMIKHIKKEEYLDFLIFTQSLDKELNNIKFLVPELREKKLNNILKEALNIDGINKVYQPLYNYYVETENREKKLERERNKKLYGYRKLLDILKQDNNKKEIINIDKYLENIHEKDLETIVLKYIYSHNKKYYDELEKEYIYKSENSINNYISYFNEMSISFNDQDEKLQQDIMKDTLDIIKQKVSYLQKLHLNEKELLNLLAKSNLETIKQIDDLLKNSILNKEFILNNLIIYYNLEKFETLLTNINCLIKEKVNLKTIEEKEFLLIDNQMLIKNIELLKTVGINLKTIKGNNLKMLSDANLLSKITSLIELGLEKQIVVEPDILNLDDNLPKRIVIAKTVGMDIIKDDKLNPKIASSKDFFVMDSMLAMYLLDRNNSNYNCNKTIIFDEVEKDNNKQYFEIEGIRIPKLRVNNLKISLENIIKPSFYTKEEVKTLEKYRNE